MRRLSHDSRRLLPASRPRRARAFTLIEALVVAAVIALLAALLLPSLARARLQARLAKVRAELYQVSLALVAYEQEFGMYPHASTSCFAGGAEAERNYSHLPPVLAGRYMGSIPEDVFNPGCSYKYLRPGRGWGNNGPSSVTLYVPRDFPYDRFDGSPRDDLSYWSERGSPVEFVVWSVGPSGPRNAFESHDLLHYPIPRRTWYRRTRGLEGEGVVPLIKMRKRFIQWEG